MKSTIQTKKVIAGTYSILLNGEKVGVVDKTTHGWMARGSIRDTHNIRIVKYTKNEAVGEYVKEIINNQLGGK